MNLHVPRDLKLIPIEKLIPYERNARTHSDEQVDQISASIREFGFTNPILIDGDHGIIAGHGRLLAAKKLGIKQVPVIELVHLTPAQKRAYILADNKLALNAGWDMQLLESEMSELATLTDIGFDLTVTGFSLKEIEELTVGPLFEPGTSEEQGKLDEKKKIKCPECDHEFTP